MSAIAEPSLLARLVALPLFRTALDVEIDAPFAAYARGDFAGLCDTWCAVASAQRATLTSGLQRGYDHAGMAPRAVNAYGFLATVRAVLDAGVRFRATLSPPTRDALLSDFPWLARRHEHVPPGWSPHFDFPREFAEWIDVPDVDEAKRRWQLATGLNEVQQAHNTADCARRFRLPILLEHAARERALAINYFSHWAPTVSRSTFRDCVLALDALNAAVFALLCLEQPGQMVRRSIVGAIRHADEWKAFVAAMGRPQWLLPPPR
ncbi:MAG: hypothetical protein ABI321_18310 [Polyangia bacterium]